ncbi:MAG: hypothetical protein HC921_14280 [Synechococcaceae cyanobacterium SM2_3_1]|nr:hypothetical protein [Synechococcaceae cyanobacterium SM2_3_1]
MTRRPSCRVPTSWRRSASPARTSSLSGPSTIIDLQPPPSTPAPVQQIPQRPLVAPVQTPPPPLPRPVQPAPARPEPPTTTLEEFRDGSRERRENR